MEAMVKIGECIWLGACVVGVFVVFGMLTTARFDIVIKVAIPVFGFLIGACMGAFLGNLISMSGATIGALLGGIIGIAISLSSSRGP